MKEIESKRLLSIVFIFSMIMTVMGMPVFAQDIIEEIQIIDLSPPVEGKIPNTEFSTPDSVPYDVNTDSDYTYWADKDDTPFTGEFVTGENYKLYIQLFMQGDDHIFPEGDNLPVRVNGLELSPENFQYESTDHGNACQLVITFIAESTIAPSYSITVYKKDEEGSPLKGAVLFMELNDPTRELIVNEESDEEGKVIFNLEKGEYKLFELSPPTGFEKSDKEYTIYIRTDGNYIGTDTPDVEPYKPITFINRRIVTPGPERVPILVYKTDEDKRPLKDSIIKIEYAGSGLVSIEKLSDEKGEIIFYLDEIRELGGEDGEYIISEVSAPRGYDKTDKIYNIIIFGEEIQEPNIPGEDPKAYEPVTFVNRKRIDPSRTDDSSRSDVEKTIPSLIKDDHFAYMEGYPGEIFKPENNMSRGEAVVMFSRLLEESMRLDRDYRNNYYSDIEEGEWYANQISYMHILGVLKDFSQGKEFRPDEPVTRAEFAALASQFDKLAFIDTNEFIDIAEEHWAVKYINSAANKGWIKGYPDKTFKPEEYITRAEVVTLVNRVLERNADKDYLESNFNILPRVYNDVGSRHWAYLEIMEASIGHDFIKENNREKWTRVYD